ncbi:MAG: DUF4339 domain-containing protein [Chthoniobacterales bacterium]
MTVHVCASDGQRIGEFEEQDFRDALFAGRFPQDSHYWHDGMEDWRPIADYKALAKTQRISFAPPVRRTRTTRIMMDTPQSPPPKSGNAVGRLWRRLTGR